MLICKECGTEILAGTSSANDELCIPCKEGLPLFNDAVKNIRHFGKRLDFQLIDLKQMASNPSYADYEVTSSIWDIDPRFRSRSIKVGSSTGVLRIYKKTGEIMVIYPVSLDDGRILQRAKSVLSRAYEEGEFPVKTMWASG